MTRRGLRRGVLELQAAIARHVRERNRSAKPFVWTASAKSIFDKLNQINVPSE